MELGSADWVRAEHHTDVGNPLPYYVHIRTGEMQWELPESEHLIDLTKIASNVGKFVARLKQEVGSRDAIAGVGESELADLDYDDLAERSSAVTGSKSYHNKQKLSRMLKKPTARQEAENMPWLYFRQMSLVVIFVWVATMIATIVVQVDTLVNLGQVSNDVARPSLQVSKATPIHLSVQLLHVSWPHATFLPSAVACAGRTVVLGDRFEIYSLELPSHPTKQSHLAPASQGPLEMQVLVSTKNIPAPWSALALVCSEQSEWHLSGISHCSAVVMLEKSGRAVWEQPLPAAGKKPRRWPLGASFVGTLESITVASRGSEHCPGGAFDWAVLGATEAGDAVAFCPQDDQLQPARRVATRDSMGTSARLGAQGDVWRLETDFSLPSGRIWARGLCELGEPQGRRAGRSFVVAGVVDSTAELYQLGDLPAGELTSLRTEEF